MPPDLKALGQKAQKNALLAPKGVIVTAQPGAIYVAKDEHLRFPVSEAIGKRERKFVRPVVVVQDRQLSRAGDPQTILVVPCSSTSPTPNPWDYLIPGDEEAFDRAHVIAYTSLVQPIVKAALVEYKGQLRPQTLVEIQRIIVANLGLLQTIEIELPPRNNVRKSSDELTGSDAQ